MHVSLLFDVPMYCCDNGVCVRSEFGRVGTGGGRGGTPANQHEDYVIAFSDVSLGVHVCKVSQSSRVLQSLTKQ